MFDELERLDQDEHLLALLAHYARAGGADREAWQDRVMAMEGVRPEDLVKLHGELLAYEWIEPNTAAIPVPRTGGVPLCYRATAAGLRAFQQGQPRDKAAA
jgi:hypothetical protein